MARGPWKSPSGNAEPGRGRTPRAGGARERPGTGRTDGGGGTGGGGKLIPLPAGLPGAAGGSGGRAGGGGRAVPAPPRRGWCCPVLAAPRGTGPTPRGRRQREPGPWGGTGRSTGGVGGERSLCKAGGTWGVLVPAPRATGGSGCGDLGVQCLRVQMGPCVQWGGRGVCRDTSVQRGGARGHGCATGGACATGACSGLGCGATRAHRRVPRVFPHGHAVLTQVRRASRAANTPPRTVRIGPAAPYKGMWAGRGVVIGLPAPERRRAAANQSEAERRGANGAARHCGSCSSAAVT